MQAVSVRKWLLSTKNGMCRANLRGALTLAAEEATPTFVPLDQTKPNTLFYWLMLGLC